MFAGATIVFDLGGTLVDTAPDLTNARRGRAFPRLNRLNPAADLSLTPPRRSRRRAMVESEFRVPANGGLVQVLREKEMLRRLVTGVAIVCLMGGAAYAQQDEEPVDSECAQQLTTAQETVQDKVDNNALSEDDQEKIYALMDEADALCTEGKSDEAIATLATVNKMVAGQ
jgi:phosphoglycolate phosphatase-like HAD superfamily hydrolase